jgi:hypothetical protein
MIMCMTMTANDGNTRTRIHSATRDPLSAIAPAGRLPTRKGLEKDVVWTGFFATPLLGIHCNNFNYNHLRAALPRDENISGYAFLKHKTNPRSARRIHARRCYKCYTLSIPFGPPLVPGPWGAGGESV